MNDKSTRRSKIETTYDNNTEQQNNDNTKYNNYGADIKATNKGSNTNRADEEYDTGRILRSRDDEAVGKAMQSTNKHQTYDTSQDSNQLRRSGNTYTSGATMNPKIHVSVGDVINTTRSGPVEDINSTQHGPEAEINTFNDRIALQMQIKSTLNADLTVQPQRSIKLLSDTPASILTFQDPFQITANVEPFIVYKVDEMIVNMPNNRYDPLDTVSKLIFPPSINTFKYGTGIAQHAYSDIINSMFPSNAAIISTITDHVTYINRTEFYIKVMVYIMMDRKILTMDFYDIDASQLNNDFILNSIPKQTGISPILRVDTRSEPIWYNDAIKNLATDLNIKYGKIKTILDSNAVRKFVVVGYPLDQYRAMLYNHNLLEYFGQKVRRDDILAYIRALSYEFESITISDIEYQNVRKWYSDADLSRYVFVLCMCPDIIQQLHAINFEYFSRANVFTVRPSNDLIQTILSNSNNMEPTIIRWFQNRICSIDKTVIDDYFSHEMTPITARPILISGSYERYQPTSLLYILELVLFSIIFPNITQHILGQMQARILEIAMTLFDPEYAKFINKFGFFYRIVNNRKEYIKVTNKYELMPENVDVLTGDLYPSLFTDDPSLSTIAPNLAKIASLMKPTTTPAVDHRALNAKFPRFKNSAHLNPFVTLNTGRATSHSPTAQKLNDAISSVLKIMMNVFSINFPQRTRAGIHQLRTQLLSMSHTLGLGLDGYVYHLFNVMANMPQNFIPNTDGNFHSYRACPYVVFDNGTNNIYKLIQSGDETSNLITVDTSIVWNLYGNCDNAYCNALGITGTANVPTRTQPLIPRPDEFIELTLNLKTSIDAISSVEGLLLLIFSRTSSIPDYDNELNMLRQGIVQSRVTEGQYRKAREAIQRMIGDGKYSVAPLHFLLYSEHRSTKLSEPLIRRYQSDSIQPFSQTLDPIEFQHTPALIENSNLARLKIALKLLTSDMDNVVQGLIIHVRMCTKFDVYETLTIPAGINTIDFSEQNVTTAEFNNIPYYVFLINNVRVQADDVENVNFKITNTGIWPDHIVTLLLRAVDKGKNVYISLPNSLYRPSITADARNFNNNLTVRRLLDDKTSIIHDIMFFDNALQPKQSSDMFARSDIIYRTIWNTSVITQRISARGIISLNNERPPDSKICSQSEIDMGSINQNNGELFYTSGVNKLDSTKVSMFNNVLVSNEDSIHDATVKYTSFKTQDIIQFT